MRHKTFIFSKRLPLTVHCLLFTAYCLLFTAYCLLFFPACSKENSKQPQAYPPVPVTVATVAGKSVPLQVRAIGNVETYSTVGVNS